MIDEQMQRFIDKKLTHQLHTSERKAFRACRRRWEWVYRDMYHPIVTPEPLEFGVAFHKAMETFYEPRMWTSHITIRRDLAKVAFRRECEAQMRRYRQLDPDPDVEILESYKSRISLGLEMLMYYCDKVSPEYDRGFVPIRVEVPFEVPIFHPETNNIIRCGCSQCYIKWRKATANQPSEFTGLPVTYGGRIDMLAQDSIGRLWPYDWKTTARMLDEDAEASFLQLDDQISSYCWALAQLDIRVAGFVYVEIKKTFPKPPELLTRKYKGRLISTDRTTLTTLELALKTIQEQDNDGWQMGLYDNYLEWLRTDGPQFTQRHQIHKNEHEIDSAGVNIAWEALDIISNPKIYPQPGRFSCNYCMFKQPCIGKNMGEDYEYTLKTLFERHTKHYWEEESPSTE